MSKTKLVIIGGIAGGASAATRARRSDVDAEIVLFDRTEHLSVATCGMPYYIGGEIVSRDKLLVAKEATFVNRFHIDVRTMHEVLMINRDAKFVQVKNLRTGDVFEESYDKLIIATGASPFIPPIEGIKSSNVFTLHDLWDTDKVFSACETASSVAVIGAGYIGLELVEQFVRRGIKVSVAELKPQVLPLFDPELAFIIEEQLLKNGVELFLNDGIKSIIAENGEAKSVVLNSGTQIDADFVIIGIGVRPNVSLARDCGIEIGKFGGILTNDYMQTNDSDIYAVGDAVEYKYGPTDTTLPIALAGPANKAGRIAGEHAVLGSSSKMSSVLGTSILRVFDATAAMTGLTMTLAEKMNIDAKYVTVNMKDHAGYYPGATELLLKIVFSPEDGKLLGAQASGEHGVDKRIDICASVMQMGGTVYDLAGLDLCYAPPFGSAKDPIHFAAFGACNILDHYINYINCDDDMTGYQLLDVRTVTEVEEYPIDGAVNIPVDDLIERCGELDQTKETVVICRVGIRAHYGARILQQKGFDSDKVFILQGGVTLRDLISKSKHN